MDRRLGPAQQPRVSKVDRSSILLAVYTAFSEAVAQGIWHAFPPLDLATMVLVNAVLLGAVLLITTWGARRLGLSKENEITLVFCGSKKSLASGIPLATVLFGTSQMGIVVLPLMIFHQMQLMVCAVLARRYADREAPAAGTRRRPGLTRRAWSRPRRMAPSQGRTPAVRRPGTARAQAASSGRICRRASRPRRRVPARPAP